MGYGDATYARWFTEPSCSHLMVVWRGDMGSMGMPLKSRKPPKGSSPRLFRLFSLLEPRSTMHRPE